VPRRDTWARGEGHASSLEPFLKGGSPRGGGGTGQRPRRAVHVEVPTQDHSDIIVGEPAQEVGETMSWAVRDEMVV
jgi:hypothetical protein